MTRGSACRQPLPGSPRFLLASLFALLAAACGGGGGGESTGVPPPYAPVLLSRFPVSLDVLFRAGDPVRQGQMLDGIRAGRPEATMPFLVPYPNYNHSGHFPATLKWYLYTQTATPIALSAPGFLEVRGDAGAATQILNGVPCLVDITATIHLSYYIRVELGHACIAKALVDEYHAAAPTDVFGQRRQAIPVAADTVLGSTLTTGALDFILQDDTHYNFDPQGAFSNLQNWVNPFFYFTPAVQEQLWTYCQPQLAAMTDSGLYPESSLDRTFAINEAGSYFGTWFYHSGPLQPGPTDHPMGWYSFSGGIVNLLNVARTDPATFWKDANTGLPFGPGMVGVFCDATVTGTMPGFMPLGGRYLYREEGDARSGILRLTPFFYNQTAGTVYLKLLLREGDPGTPWDDQLDAEPFPTLGAAQGPFTAARSTYYRMYERIN